MVWITRHRPLDSQESEIKIGDSFPQAAWFLDNDGVREENVWKWQRFVAVQISHRPPWFSGTEGGWRTSIFGRTHEIGWAAFAPYRDSDLYYLETVWGYLHGMGNAITFDDSSKNLQRQLWIS